MKKYQIVLTIILGIFITVLVATLGDEGYFGIKSDPDLQSMKILDALRPDPLEKEQREVWKEGLDYTSAAYETEYNETKYEFDIIGEALNPLQQFSLAMEVMLDAEVRENFVEMSSILNYTVHAMADWVLIKHHEINPEPLANGKMTIAEVLKHRILLKAQYKEDGEDFDAEWLHCSSCLPATKQYHEQILQEAKKSGEVDESYFNQYYNAPFFGDSRGVTELHDFRLILSDYYEWVEEPLVSYDEFEVWACCYMLYGKDFDFKTIRKIIAEKTIAGNVELKQNVGHPIIVLP